MTLQRRWEWGAVAALLLVGATVGGWEVHVWSLNRQLCRAADLVDTREMLRLVKAGADVRTRTPQGMSCLMVATFSGDTLLAGELLARGAPANEHAAVSGDTPLHAAVDVGGRDLVALLLAHGAEVDARNASGQTPLIRAAAGDGPDVPDCAAELLRHGADISARDLQGVTATAAARRTERPCLFKFLARRQRADQRR